MGVSPERESPPPFIPPALKSPTIKNAQLMSRAERIRQEQAQYHREHQGHPRSSTSPQPSSTTMESSRSSSLSPPHQATISEITEDQLEDVTPMPSIDELVEEMSDLQLLEKSTKRLQASFWRPVPGALTSKMHRILEGLRVVMENQEGVYYNH